MKVENVQINGSTGLIGFNGDTITVSWELTEVENPELKIQRIIVSSDIRGEHVIADKKSADLNNAGETIKVSLPARNRCYVLVQAVDGDMHPAQSEAVVIETGKMNESWTGQVISGDGEGIFLKDIHVDTESGKLGFATDLWHTTEKAAESEPEEGEEETADVAERRIVSARFYMEAEKSTKVRVNGMEAVNDGSSDVYDVTDFMGEDNLIEVETAAPFRGELHIRFIDSEEVYATDGEWLFRKKGSRQWSPVNVSEH